jgi:hypothetical protein
MKTFNIAMLLCVSVAFKFLNRVADCYKYSVKTMMTLGGTRGA